MSRSEQPELISRRYVDVGRDTARKHLYVQTVSYVVFPMVRGGYLSLRKGWLWKI